MTINVKSSARDYNIHFLSSSDALADLTPHDILITDSNLIHHYPQVNGLLQPIVVPAGESSKSLDTYQEILDQLASRNVQRSQRVIAFGGGVVGDLAGFVAATYLRGLTLIQIPTSLLAMVDSSVGGKVGIDLPAGKNLVGSFYPPHQVRISTEWLSTLPSRQVANGMAEVIKYGLILDRELYETLKQPDLSIEMVIARCVELKKQVVEQDEFETSGERAKLNFGHTLGHAIEKSMGYQGIEHGEAVAIGMVYETRLAEEIGIARSGLSAEIESVCVTHGLPTKWPSDLHGVMDALSKDKKNLGDGIAFAFVSQIGECKLHHNISRSEVDAFLRRL